MKKTVIVLFTLILVAAGIGLPLWLAIEESARQAFKAESTHALGYARDVVLRVDETGRQVQVAVRRLEAQAAPPCSPASIDLMRDIDLASTYIQAVGYVEGSRMLCSSIAGPERILELGPPSYTSSGGALVRSDVRFPFAPQHSYVVLQFGRYAAILHGRLLIDTAKGEADVSLAAISVDYSAPLSARGYVDPTWVARLGNAREAVFSEDGHIVAVVRSTGFQAAGIAAVPLRYLEARSHDFAMRLVPAGLLAGIVLSLAILFLARHQMALPAAVKAALRRKEFFLEYQPVVDLRTGKWMGVEALVRWRRPTGEIVMPDMFIPIAEQHELIVQLTEQVLTGVCHDAGSYLQSHPDFHVGINVSPADFHTPNFMHKLQLKLEAMQARPGNLILEVTERGLLDPVVARETTGSLRRHGFAVAIDDFGTGYSSLSYLESLELDYLKIDRSFIEAIGTGAPTSQVVGHIIGMAKDLGLCMIAEGVESQAQAEFLRKRGVQYAQGWLFGRSMAFSDIVRRIEEMEQEAGAVQVAG
ncbi:EAL domain-containing protein [Massilia sp. IC2-477]|uniref:EAL domain-containing protein n=1 Tax=Massilia sp. IC2-477 TaxID=2887198 RepID=UPI001D128B19|nr:EAL domain-containing protein [Massilia sp. IC2-477]MCC2957506.1 EAL domain-containing protein [Massilia sp. IC2-477]